MADEGCPKCGRHPEEEVPACPECGQDMPTPAQSRWLEHEREKYVLGLGLVVIGTILFAVEALADWPGIVLPIGVCLMIAGSLVSSLSQKRPKERSNT